MLSKTELNGSMPKSHRVGCVDLVGGCRAFVSVAETGSFTAGAAVAHIPQPVASRRIAALERHFGERLFDRTTRRARLTPFGRDMLPSAKRLVQLADAMEHDAKRARLRPLRVAVPDTCGVRELAELAAEARALELYLEFRAAPPGERAELVRTSEVRAARLLSRLRTASGRCRSASRGLPSLLAGWCISRRCGRDGVAARGAGCGSSLRMTSRTCGTGCCERGMRWGCRPRRSRWPGR